jgi:hypothetical protein
MKVRLTTEDSYPALSLEAETHDEAEKLNEIRELLNGIVNGVHPSNAEIAARYDGPLGRVGATTELKIVVRQQTALGIGAR